MQTPYLKEIENYYDESLRDYEIVWQLKKAMALHYGYWDQTTNTHKQALWNMNFQVAKHAQISENDYVLDAGCGVGGTSFFLAKNIGCKVEGISLAPAHIQRANQYKKNNDPNNLTRFTCQNFCQTHFQDHTFDVVFGIESVVHASIKQAFLKEAYRVLKPGGRLLISDYFLREPTTTVEKEILKKWGNSWAIENFIYEKEFHKQLKSEGFKSPHFFDITDKVYPSIKLMHRSYYPGIAFSSVQKLLGKTTQKRVENSKSGKFQYQAFQKKMWKYKHALAYKQVEKDVLPHELNNPCELYIDHQTLKEQFPVFVKYGFRPRNILKRIMHFYLEKNIRNPNQKF